MGRGLGRQRTEYREAFGILLHPPYWRSWAHWVAQYGWKPMTWVRMVRFRRQVLNQGLPFTWIGFWQP